VAIAGGQSFAGPVKLASPAHYRIGDSDASNPSLADPGTLVRDALAQCQDLLSERGKGPGNHLATGIIAAYASFDEVSRAAFFDGLVDRFSVDASAVRRAAESYIEHSTDDTLQALLRASDPPRRELFLRLNGAPGGSAWLVRMREHLQTPRWASIETDLTHVLRVVFNRAMLEFQEIDLETPSGVLERLIEAEAVHPVNDWREMGRQLEIDRRCYAFCHPAWPREPLIFTKVALTRGIPSTIRPILDPDAAVVNPRTCDTAIFYSISNCQPGLRGFSFGNDLLNRAIERLRAEMPWLRRFATISPIPGFRSWLAASIGVLNPSTRVRTWLSNQPLHSLSDAIPGDLKDELLALCAHYLLAVKRSSEPADPVARFHLGNGARLHRLNSSSDLSRTGISRSLGLTVNYVYDLTALERNAKTYGCNHEICASPEVVRRARRAAPLMCTPSLVP